MGGEALPPVLAARFGQRLPNAHLHNAYGPTETTVDATGKQPADPMHLKLPTQNLRMHDVAISSCASCVAHSTLCFNANQDGQSVR